MSDREQWRLPDDEQYYYANYFLKIEALFAALRGRSLLLSPADYQLAKSWYDKGIPLSCVLRGVRAAYLSKLTESEDPDEEVRSLSWCRWAVQKEWKEYRAVPVEPAETEYSPPERSGDEVRAILESLIFDVSRSRDIIQERGNEAITQELGRVIVELKELQKSWHAKSGEIERLEEQLRELDERMITAVAGHLDQETNRKIERSISRKLKQYVDSMDEEARQKTRRSAFRSKVRTTLQLPLLTLYML